MKASTYFKTSIGIAALAVLTSFTSKAQITITDGDLLQVGSSYINASDTAPKVNPGAAGANQNWDLTGLKNDVVDTEFAVSPLSTPYAPYFTTNLATRANIPGLGKAYEYDNIGPDSLTVQGTAVPILGTTAIGINTPSAIGLVFPATYNTKWSGSYRNVEKYSALGDSVKGVTLVRYTDTIDGWGNVTTPAGTFPALRINTIFTTIYDSSYYNIGLGWIFAGATHPVQAQMYAWYAKWEGAPIATLNLDTVGKSVSSASYLLKPGSPAGINEISDNTSSLVYPNPASSSINIVVKSANTDGYIKIIDLTGREIESAAFNNNKAQFNTSSYANGMYLYLITDMSGNLLDKGKFTVIH